MRPRSRWLFLAVGLVLFLAGMEGYVRRRGAVLDGVFWFAGRPIPPLRPPVERVEDLLRQLASGRPYVRYDPETGWAPESRATSRDRLYATTDDGIRAPATDTRYATDPTPGTLRIAVFGDSFAHGSDVPFSATWAQVLERALTARGRPAEVLNFGVGGYGMDQAFLRWRQLGRRYRPDVVIFGFQAENALRNLNLVRALYHGRTDLPFTKPRFVEEPDGLRLVNHPAAPPEAVPEILRDLEAWPLRSYERYYDVRRYRPRPWSSSRLASVTYELAIAGRTPGSPEDPRTYELDREASRLTLRILDLFAADVRSAGARFLVVHLPRSGDLLELERGRPLTYEALLGAVADRFEVVDPASAMLGTGATASVRDLFSRPGQHYSASGSTVVGSVVAARLAEQSPRSSSPGAR